MAIPFLIMSPEISDEWRILGLPAFAEYTRRRKGLQSQKAIVFRAGSGRSVPALAALDDLSRVLTDDQRIICQNRIIKGPLQNPAMRVIAIGDVLVFANVWFGAAVRPEEGLLLFHSLAALGVLTSLS
jgi:hypothetical protein